MLAIVRAVAALAAIALIACRTTPPAGPFALSDDTETWGELAIRGRLGLSVSPDGQVWLTSYSGEAVTTRDPFGHWVRREMPVPKGDPYALVHATIDRISFFSPDTAIAFGYLAADTTSSETDRLLQTVDGGKHWTMVAMGADEWVYTAALTPEGHAWIGGSSGILRRSRDFGRTWERLGTPFDEDDRIMSVVMRDTLRGFATSGSGVLKRTSDGGRTWSIAPGPDLPQPPVEAGSRSTARLGGLVRFGDRLVARFGEQTIISPIDSIAWTPAEIPSRGAVVSADELRMFAIDSMGRVVVVDRTLTAHLLHGEAPPNRVTHLAPFRGGVLALDEAGALVEVRGQGLRYAFTLDSARPIATPHRVRISGGQWYGASAHHLYESADSGATWRRIAISPYVIAGFEPRADGRLLVWDRHGHNAALDPRTGSRTTVSGLDSLDIVDVIRTGSTWYAYGGRQYESAARIDVARTIIGGQFAGSTEGGHVLRSVDGGVRWTRIDDWADHGVAALGIGVDGTLVALSHLGSVRVIEQTASGYRAETRIEADSTNRDRVPYVQNPFVLHMASPTEMWVVGDTHYRGLFTFRTGDGGRTWQSVEPSTFGYSSVIPVEGGAVASTGSRLDLLRDGIVSTLMRLDCGDDPEWLGMGEGVRGGCIIGLSVIDGERLLVSWDAGRFDPLDERPPRHQIVRLPVRSTR